MILLLFLVFNYKHNINYKTFIIREEKITFSFHDLSLVTIFVSYKHLRIIFMQIKVVFITGASSGIGKALVKEFAKRGAKIAMGARNLEELQKNKTDLKSRGVDALSVQSDVTRELDCKNLVDDVWDTRYNFFSSSLYGMNKRQGGRIWR